MKTNNLPSALRIKTAVILLSLIGCFMSCKSKSEPEQPSSNALTEKAKEVATYLTDNYTIGDSVFFLKKTGETEGFMVTKNHFAANEDLSEYLLETSMESNETTFDIQISVTEPMENFFYIDGSISLNHDSDEKPYLTTKVKGDSIIISVSGVGKKGILQKDIGLIRLFKNSSSWDLIQ